MKKIFISVLAMFFTTIFTTKAQNSVAQKKGIIAIFAMCSTENSVEQRKYTEAIAEEVRIQLNEDKTITVLPSSISENLVVSLIVPGFVSSIDELKKVASQLPADCNVLIVAGPFPNDNGFFNIRIEHPSDLMGVSFNFGPPKLDKAPKEVVFGGVIRGDIDIVLNGEKPDDPTAKDWDIKVSQKFIHRDYEGVITDCDYAIVLDPKNIKAYDFRGSAKRFLGRYTDAIADFDQAIALNPKNATSYNNRGMAKNKLGNYSDAIVDYDKVIALDPKNQYVFTNRGLSKINLGNYADAIADLDKAISLISLNQKYFVGYAYNCRGYAYYKLGNSKANYQKAITDYDKCIQLGPPDYNPQFQYRDDAVVAMTKTVNP